MAGLSIYRLLHLLRREADLVKMNVTAIDLERERFIQIRYNAWGPTTGRMGSLNGQRRLHKHFSKDSHLYGSKEDVWQYHLKIKKKEKKISFSSRNDQTPWNRPKQIELTESGPTTFETVQNQNCYLVIHPEEIIHQDLGLWDLSLGLTREIHLATQTLANSAEDVSDSWSLFQSPISRA